MLFRQTHQTAVGSSPFLLVKKSFSSPSLVASGSDTLAWRGRERRREREREEREKNRMCGLLDKRGLGERETAWLVITESPRATSLAIMMQLKLAVISLILADMADGICLEPLGIFFIPLPPFFFSFLFFNGPATGIETRMCPLEIDVRRRAGSLMPPINATAQLRGSQYCAVAASLSKAKSDTRERCF